MARFRIWSNTAEYLSLSAIDRPVLADLYRYWRDLSVNGVPPRQKDLALHDMPDCLSNIALIDVARPTREDKDLPPGFPLRARYLLVGEALTRLLGENPTGMLINEVYSRDVAQEVGGALFKSMDTQRPLYYRREFQILRKSFGYDRLILPMRLQASEVRRILLAIFPLDKKLVSADQWRGELEKFEAMQEMETRMSAAWAESLGYAASPEEDLGPETAANGSAQEHEMDASNYFDLPARGRSSD
ncbi:hypothetical protein [Thalassobaculum salexigens]|uniref:hypothetical protein n=1 Tax=Thalassobaculum salexigens TaxID=455360 RepID=UPI0003F8B221|nr:hypothetical protein [Thalassobaculum salexigens]